MLLRYTQPMIKTTDKACPFWLRIRELLPHMTDTERVAELRRITGVKQGSASRWKTGSMPVGRKNLRKIAIALRVNIHWLETGEGDRFIARNDDPFIVEMTARVDKLNEVDKEELIALAEMKCRRNRE